MVALLIFVFLGLLFIGVPIGMGIGIAAWIVVLIKGTFPSTIIAHKMANGVNSFPLIAVPLYILQASWPVKQVLPLDWCDWPMPWSDTSGADWVMSMSWPPCSSEASPDQRSLMQQPSAPS